MSEDRQLIAAACAAYIALGRQGWEPGPTEDEAKTMLADALAELGIETPDDIAEYIK